MPKVICKLQNASEKINGVKFERQADGSVLSEEVSEEAAAAFAAIPGYEVAPDEGEKKPADDGKKAAGGSKAKAAAPADGAGADANPDTK